MPNFYLPQYIPLSFIFRQYVPSQRFLFDRSSIAKLKNSHSANVVCDGSCPIICIVCHFITVGTIAAEPCPTGCLFWGTRNASTPKCCNLLNICFRNAKAAGNYFYSGIASIKANKHFPKKNRAADSRSPVLPKYYTSRSKNAIYRGSVRI